MASDARRPETAPRRRGRPHGCTPEAVGMLRGLIRELGLSDSAAAERMGIGVSTLSRWKREDPEVRVYLRQAREECRALHLMRIIETSQAAHGKGWRASAWILERLFPEDYAPSATQREKFRALAERRREEEERAGEEAELEDLMAAAQESAMDAMQQGEAEEPEIVEPTPEDTATTIDSRDRAPRPETATRPEGRAPELRSKAEYSTPEKCSTPAAAAGTGVREVINHSADDAHN